MHKLLQWAIGSTQAKKWSGVIGGFALGLWVSGRYWREIRAMREIWGIDKEAWLDFLVAVVGVCGVGLSVALSVAKKRKERARGADK